MLSILLIYLSMKNFSVNNNKDDVIINTSMAATMATKPSLINSSKSQSQSQPKEQIIQTGATTTTVTAAATAAVATATTAAAATVIPCALFVLIFI